MLLLCFINHAKDCWQSRAVSASVKHMFMAKQSSVTLHQCSWCLCCIELPQMGMISMWVLSNENLLSQTPADKQDGLKAYRVFWFSEKGRIWAKHAGKLHCVSNLTHQIPLYASSSFHVLKISTTTFYKWSWILRPSKHISSFYINISFAGPGGAAAGPSWHWASSGIRRPDRSPFHYRVDKQRQTTAHAHVHTYRHFRVASYANIHVWSWSTRRKLIQMQGEQANSR